MRYLLLAMCLAACGPRSPVDELPEPGADCACGHQAYQDGKLVMLCLPLPPDAKCAWANW